MPATPREQVETNGYYIAQIVSGAELTDMQRTADRMYERIHGAKPGDGPERHGRYFLDADSPMRPFFYLAHDRRFMTLVEEILGGPLVWQGASMLVSGPNYTQGWHRDTLQIPQEKIDDAWFSPDVFFNNIQFNMGLFDDSCLWVVPGSHHRPLTPGESAAFAGSRHMTQAGVEMPGGVPVDLKAGQCVFYNNNLIHRGHNGRHQKRVTFHSSYARGDLPPTWHAYGLRNHAAGLQLMAELGPEFRKLRDDYLDLMRRHPDYEKSWFIPDAARRAALR